MTTKNTNGFRNKLFILLILTLFLILLPAAVYAESDPAPSGDVAADDSSATSDAPDASAATEPSESSSSSSSETTPDSSATETTSPDSETLSTESADSQTPPEQPSEDLLTSGDGADLSSDLSNDPSSENETLSEESLEPADLTTGEETEEPDSSDLSGDDEGDQAAEGNSYVATITPDAVVDGDTGDYPEFAVTGQENVEFTVTFTEVGDKAIGSAQVKMPDLNGTDGFRDFAFDPSTIQTSSGQQWNGELVSLNYLNLWASSTDDYLQNGESVSATFTATTPNTDNRAAYEFETDAWTDAAPGFDGVGSTVNNMAVGYSDPVVIVGLPVNSAAELAAIDNDNVSLSDHYVQVADIDLGVSPYNTGDGWEPIGSAGDNFTGSFNGNDFTISNLYIDRSNDLGLFAVTGEDARLLNIHLRDVDITGTSNSVGALVGMHKGIISGSSATGKVTGYEYVGGLVGENFEDAVVVDSYSTCEVNGSSNGGSYPNSIGGLVGSNRSDGIIAYGIIAYSYATGDVKGDYRKVGGLVGENDGKIVYSHATGAVESIGRYAGGLVGDNDDGVIINCYATGDVIGYSHVGGLAGENDNRVENSYATGNVTGTGESRVGGLVGDNDDTIINCYATGNVTSSEDDVGGLAGDNDGEIYGSYATGNVVGVDNVGGLVGDNGGSNRVIENSYATGNVTGNHKVGGLVGSNGNGYYDYSDHLIMNSYATGNVTGDSDVGGLVGLNNGTITSCFAAGEATGNQYVGGLIGWNNNPTTTNSFAVQEPVIGAGTQSGASPTTITAMKQLATYDNVGWDIALLSNYDPDNPDAYTWYIDEGSDYPILWWQDMPEEPAPSIVAIGGFYFDFPALLFAQPSTSVRGGILYGTASLITPWFVQTGSVEKLAAAREAYEQFLLSFEANKDSLSDRELARQQVELAVALAAIRALEATLAAKAGQGYDLSAVISAYQTALNLVETHANHLTGYQRAYALLVLSTVAEAINNLGGSVN